MIEKKDVQLGDLFLLSNGYYYLYVYCRSWRKNIFIRNGGYYKISGLNNYNEYLQYIDPYLSQNNMFDILKIYRPYSKYTKRIIEYTTNFYFPISYIIHHSVDITNGTKFTIVDLNNYS